MLATYVYQYNFFCIGISFQRIDSSTIGISWSVGKTASSFLVSAYHNNKFLDSRSFSGTSRNARLINATAGVTYTMTVKASYQDGTSATGEKDVWTY